MCHSKRMVSRRDLPKVESLGWEPQRPAIYKDYEPDERDVVMFSKQLWPSTSFAQSPPMPLLVQLFEKLLSCTTKTLPTESLTARRRR